jgi:hypothetical protein
LFVKDDCGFIINFLLGPADTYLLNREILERLLMDGSRPDKRRLVHPQRILAEECACRPIRTLGHGRMEAFGVCSNHMPMGESARGVQVEVDYGVLPMRLED